VADERTGPAEDVERTTGTAPTPGRRPSASAASRARRIGGRPTTGAATGNTDAPAGSEAGASPQSPKPSRPPKPQRPPAPPSAGRAGSAESSDTVGDTAADTSVLAEAGEKDGTPAKSRAGSDRTVAWLTWTPAVVLAAAALAMAIVIAVVSHGVWWGERYNAPSKTNPLRDQVTAAAKTCLARTNSYDYRNLAAFEKAGLACTTGQETTQFRQAVQNIIKPNATKIKATQGAQINTTGIESVSGNQWTLLVYGQLKVTNSSTPKGRVDPFAAEVRMEKAHGKWLISSEKVVSEPAS
jgi:hypothetical protein